MQNKEKLNRLKAELELDLSRLTGLERKNETAAKRIDAGAVDELDFAALGYTIHNLFCLIENYALRIAKAFENDIDPGAWHRDLVERMELEIDGVRPAVWDRSLGGQIDELRRFRHAFRNMYANDLDSDKVSLIQQRIPDAMTRFRAAHEVFLDKLDYMIAGLRE